MFNTICIACIIIGILIPFCSIVLNLFDGFVDFISIDIFQLEFGSDMVLDFLPFSINSLCLWALVFGCTGMIFNGKLSEPALIVIGIVAQEVILRLKQRIDF